MGSKGGRFSPRSPRRHHHRAARCDGGFALIWALFLFVVVVGIALTGTDLTMAHRKAIDVDYARYAQATQLARAGLTETLGWFRKQTAQPVAAFAPVLDPLSDPPILDTDDPEVGIVREFRVGGNVWGRYEVWKQWDADPDATRLVWRKKIQTSEVSRAMQLGAGGSWRVRAVGTVFVRSDESKAFDAAPNRVIASELLETQIRRVVITPPGQAAINARNGSAVTIAPKARVFGGATGAGIYFPQGGAPQTGPAGSNRVLGNPPLAPASTYDDSYQAVFGVNLDELQSMADDIVTDMSAFPVPVKQNSLVVVKAPAVSFSSARPLRATAAIMVVQGDMVLQPGNLSSFSGFLYVDGNLTIHEPCEFKGAIVATGAITVQGNADFADVYYDDEVLNRLRQNVGNYRISGALRKPTL